MLETVSSSCIRGITGRVSVPSTEVSPQRPLSDLNPLAVGEAVVSGPCKTAPASLSIYSGMCGWSYTDSSPCVIRCLLSMTLIFVYRPLVALWWHSCVQLYIQGHGMSFYNGATYSDHAIGSSCTVIILIQFYCLTLCAYLIMILKQK